MNDSQCKPDRSASTPTVAGHGPPTVAAKPGKPPDQLGGLRRFALAITIFTILGHTWFGFEQSYAQPLVSVASAYVTQLVMDTLEAWAQRRRPRYANGFGALVTSLLSAHISGLACAMLLYANDRLWVVAFASSVAIASKALFRVPVGSAKGAWPLPVLQSVLFLLLLQAGDATGHWFPVSPQWLPAVRLGAAALVLFLAALAPPKLPTRHYLNPSNFGIGVTLLLFPSVGIAAPYQFTQNLGASGDWLVPLAIVGTGSFLNTIYTRRIPLALAWVSTFALQAIVSSLILGYTTGYCPIIPRLSAMTGVAFILFTFYMVTDPATTPDRPWAQVVFGTAVALVYSLFLMGHVVYGLFMALVIVCAARGLGMYLIAYLNTPKPAAGAATVPGPVLPVAAALAGGGPGTLGPSRFRRAVGYLAVLALVGALYFLSRPPALGEAEAEAIAARFRFRKLSFPEVGGFPEQTVRQVHPSLSHLSAYLSALGASAALGDLDGDGLPNDLCSIDPRIDQVILAPAPGTPADRYAPFVLRPDPLPFDTTMAPSGCLLGDFDEDGLTDALVLFWGRSPILYLQRPAASEGARLAASSFTPIELIEPRQDWFSCTATLADLDGDGHCDLVIGNYAPDGAAYLDPNGTGRQPMTESLSRSYNGGGPHFLLWKPASDGKAPFEEVDRKSILDPGSVDSRRIEEALHGWTLALGAADLDGDDLPELYISNDLGPDRLLHNRSTPGKPRFALLEGERGFFTPRSRVLGKDSFKGMGIDFGDVNGDGWLDMYVSNISGPYSLFESHFLWQSTGRVELMKRGIAPYVDAGEELGLSRSGWGWDSRLADFDNDGELEAVQAMGYLKGTINRWPEMHELGAANIQLLADPRVWPDFRPGVDYSGDDHNCFFARTASGRYHDFARRLGLDAPTVSRGIALADVDGDGRLDFATANQWEPSFLFHNAAPNPGAFLGLNLRLPIGLPPRDEIVALAGHPRADLPSRPAIGAVVAVHLPDGPRLIGQVDGGSGHSGQRAPSIHLGLGQVEADVPINVDVRWRGADGKARSRTLRLRPGWHTLWLGLEAAETVAKNETSR